MKIRGLFFDLLLVSVSLFFVMPRFLHPSLHMDESYFINASLRILSGEVLLQHTQFDKPFLTAWLPLPGILLFGENAIGFHFVHLLFYLGLGPMLRRLLEAVFDASIFERQPTFGNGWPPSQSLLPSFLCFFVATCFVLHPWTILFCAGSFSEGAFLFGVTLYFWSFLTGRLTHVNAHLSFLLLLFCIKQTAFLLFPIPAVLFMQMLFSKQPKGFQPACELAFSEGIAVFKGFLSSRLNQFLVLTFLAYGIAGPQKFAPLVFLFQPKFVGKSDRNLTDISLEMATEPFSQLALLLFVILVLVIQLHTYLKARLLKLILKRESILYWSLFISLIFHFYVIAGLPAYSGRYYIFFWLHLIACLSALSQLNRVDSNLKQAALFFFGLSMLNWPTQWQGNPSDPSRESLPDAGWAKVFAEVRHLLPKNSVVHSDGLSWYLSPFNTTNWVRFAGNEQNYIEEEQVGRKEPFFQYQIIGKPESDLPSPLLRLGMNGGHELISSDSENQSQKSTSLLKSYEISQLGLTEKEFKSTFRLRNWQTVAYTTETGSMIQLHVRKKMNCALPLTMRDSSTQECFLNLQLRGKLFISQGRLAEEKVGPGRAMLTFSIQSLAVLKNNSTQKSAENDRPNNRETFNLDFLIPVLYKSYFVSLGPVPVNLMEPGPEKSVEVADLNLELGTFILNLRESH